MFDIDFLSSLYSLEKKNKREEMCNQYEAHEVYITIRVLSMTSIVILRHPAVMNETDFSYYKKHWRKGILGLKYQFFSYLYSTSFALTCICCANPILCSKIFKKFS